MGMHIDLSQFEAAVHFLAPAVLDYTVNGREWSRRGTFSHEAAPHGAYRCLPEPSMGHAADRWCAIAAYADQQWVALARSIGKDEWAMNPRFKTREDRQAHAEEIDESIEEWTASRSAEDVMRFLQRAGVPAGVVANAQDLHTDPHLLQREHLVRLDHPEMGLRTYTAPAFRLSATPHSMRRAPLLGEHTHQVAGEFLGLTDEEFAELLADGVLEQET